MITGVILVNSDSLLTKLIHNALSNRPEINHLSTVIDSRSLFEQIPKLNPDVIVITDQIEESPLEIIANIMENSPIPCLLIHSKEHEIDKNYAYALEYGIVDVIEVEIINEKLVFPNGIPIRINILSKLNTRKFISQINQINKIKSVFIKPKLKTRIQITPSLKESDQEASLSLRKFKGRNFVSNSIIVIVASTGGPKMIVSLISQFPREFPPVIVVQHMPQGFLGAFAERINNHSNMNAKLAKDGDEIVANYVYVAPGGRHLQVKRTTGGRNIIEILDGEKVNYVKPAADVTLKSVAKIFKENTYVVVLTGMGSDGRDGCKVVKEQGGKVITLNEEESVIFGMNQSVINAGYSDITLGLNQMAYQIAQWIYS